MTRAVLLRRVLPALVVMLLAALVLVLTTTDDDDARTAGAPAAPAPVTSAPGTEEPTPDPDALPAPTEPVESPATEVVAADVVIRQGVPESARTVQAAPADFARPAQWSDGASVRVVGATQGVTRGSGPGARAGQPQTVFTVELTNGSGAPLDLNAVVVQATYGPGTQASPLYDGDTVDLGGVLAPGATATGVYAFAIPEGELGAVSLSVDVDGYRFPAVFAGAVPVR
ncbi:hypothetical protein JKP75_02620 [Blastococcus sp. TML/M2B]|uniref:hypothetical protein n=1 Tax=unclassified Blastococcus TaxID=2619396 RepID=UPI00190C2E4B|nr:MULTISPECIES: hypothetical protein [unclassified Blastococcus]MBN1091566.1 hypothetical protein [Blastococcus sp. TML/M2B]MBN1094881.1 hypothetical protein [Blastococcus sp. TML/C7B]